jgi:hypothetical protein
LKLIIIFIAFSFSIFNANAQLGDLFRKLGNAIDGLPSDKKPSEKVIKVESIPPKSTNIENQSAVGNPKLNTKNSDAILLTEERILNKRAYQIRRLAGANITQLKKQIETAFADMGFSTFSWYDLDNQKLTRSNFAMASGTDYLVFIYVRQLGDSHIMRIDIMQQLNSNQPDLSEKTYSDFWDQLGTSNFVDKMRINPREIN